VVIGRLLRWLLVHAVAEVLDPRRHRACGKAGGVAELSLMDHWFQMETFVPPTEPMLEGYTDEKPTGSEQATT
jgi:hypothetical protein